MGKVLLFILLEIFVCTLCSYFRQMMLFHLVQDAEEIVEEVKPTSDGVVLVTLV